MDGAVFQEDRGNGHGRDGPETHSHEASDAIAAPRGEPAEPQRDEDREIEEEVAVREHLKQPADREDCERKGATALAGCGIERVVQRKKRERHPPRRKHLNVRRLGGAVRVEAENQPGDEARVVATRQPVRQGVGGKRTERPRQEERDVVRGGWSSAHPDERRGHHRQSNQMLGERQAALKRPEDGTVPPLRGERHRRSVPPQNPGVEQRIAGVVRNPVELQHHREKHRGGQRCICRSDGEPPGHCEAVYRAAAGWVQTLLGLRFH